MDVNHGGCDERIVVVVSVFNVNAAFKIFFVVFVAVIKIISVIVVVILIILLLRRVTPSRGGKPKIISF